MRPKSWIIVAGICSLAAAVLARTGGMTPAPADRLDAATIEVGGVARTYHVHMPPARPRALVIVLHGAGGSGLQAARRSPLSAFIPIANREQLAVVYPDAIDASWNDCRSDAIAQSDQDDVAFLDALIARMRAATGIGARAVFLAGHSNGAIMAFRYAFERADRIGGIATVAGQLPARPEPGRCTTGPARPVPVLMTMGTADNIVPYRGGCVTSVVRCRRGTVLSAEETRDRWRMIDKADAAVAEVRRIDVDPLDGPAVEHRYRGAAPVSWWRLDGAGHSVSSRTILNDGIAGQQNRDVEFAAIAWAFFDESLSGATNDSAALASSPGPAQGDSQK